MAVSFCNAGGRCAKAKAKLAGPSDQGVQRRASSTDHRGSAQQGQHLGRGRPGAPANTTVHGSLGAFEWCVMSKHPAALTGSMCFSRSNVISSKTGASRPDFCDTCGVAGDVYEVRQLTEHRAVRSHTRLVTHMDKSGITYMYACIFLAHSL